MSTQVTILGNTGRDVELRYTPQGTPVANFSVASNTFRNTPQGKEKKTDWYNITAWGRDAETLAKYLQRGDSILVRGDLTISPWLTREGKPRINADVNLKGFDFVGTNPAKAVHETVEEVVGEPETNQPVPSTNPIEDEEETAEMLAAIYAMDVPDEAYAGQY